MPYWVEHRAQLPRVAQRQEAEQQARTVQRRDRDEVEDCQHDVVEDEPEQDVPDERRARPRRPRTGPRNTMAMTRP